MRGSPCGVPAAPGDGGDEGSGGVPDAEGSGGEEVVRAAARLARLVMGATSDSPAACAPTMVCREPGPVDDAPAPSRMASRSAAGPRASTRVAARASASRCACAARSASRR